MSKEELEKTAIELADEYIASFEGQLTLGRVCKGGVEAIGLLLLSTPEELMRLIASMAILQKAALKESGRLISDDDLGNAAWKQLKEDSGPEWWKSIPPEMLKSLKPEYLADIPPEAFEELNISGID